MQATNNQLFLNLDQGQDLSHCHNQLFQSLSLSHSEDSRQPTNKKFYHEVFLGHPVDLPLFFNLNHKPAQMISHGFDGSMELVPPNSGKNNLHPEKYETGSAQ